MRGPQAPSRGPLLGLLCLKRTSLCPHFLYTFYTHTYIDFSAYLGWFSDSFEGRGLALNDVMTYDTMK